MLSIIFLDNCLQSTGFMLCKTNTTADHISFFAVQDGASPLSPNNSALMGRPGSVWAAGLLLLLAVGGAAAAANASLPADLDSKPLLEQLLARKAFLREHLRTAEWRK
jgi:hypothetical protein